MYFKSECIHCRRWGWMFGFVQICGSFAMIFTGQNFVLVYVILQPGWRTIRMPGPEKEILNLNFFFFSLLQTVGVKMLGKSQGNWTGIEVICLEGCFLDAIVFSQSPLLLPELRMMCSRPTRSAESCYPVTKTFALPSLAGECRVAL